MNGVRIQLLYVESAVDQAPFAWYHGKALTADQRAERAQIHREMGDIVNGADLDTTAEWGRAVRCGDRLLVEVPLEPTADTTLRLIATIVVSVSRADTEWANDAAREISALLHEYGFNMPADRLARALVMGWSSERRRPFTRVPAAVGAALLMALCWILRKLQLRRRRQANEGSARPPSKVSTTKEHR